MAVFNQIAIAFFALAQSFFSALAFRDISESNDGADNLVSIITHRSSRVFHRKAGSVLAPKNFVGYIKANAVAEAGTDRALLFRVACAIRARMVHGLMGGPAHQVGDFATQHAGRGLILKNNLALEIDPMDSFLH